MSSPSSLHGATLVVEQLVTVPTSPDTVLLVFTRSPVPQMEDESEEEPPIVSQQPGVVPQSFRNVAGHAWCRVRGPTGVCWWMMGTSHVQWTPWAVPPPAQGGKQMLGAVVPHIQEQIVAMVAVDAAGITLVFQQSKSYMNLVVPQLQSIDKVLDTSFVCREGYAQAEVVDGPCDQQRQVPFFFCGFHGEVWTCSMNPLSGSPF